MDMKIDPGKAMGARIEGVDLAQPVSDEAFKRILRALGEHGVLCFPGQRLETAHSSASGACSANWRSTSPISSTNPDFRK
jgi:taurine dioxygenase